MDIATFTGILVFMGFVVAAIYHGEGMAGFKPFLNAEAFLIVMGGTFCALLINFPLSSVISVGKVKGAQLATLRALEAAGHPSIGASSIREAAVGLLGVLGGI